MDTRSGSGGKTHTPYGHDTYFQPISQWRKWWVIAPIVSLLTWMTLSYGSYDHFLQPHHDLIFILLSLALGYWIFSLCHLFAWIAFLRPRLKKPSSHALNAHRILIARKKVRGVLIHFVLASGLFAFFTILFTLQQINNDPTETFLWSDCFPFIFFSLFIAIAIFLLTLFLIELLLKINLFPKSNLRSSSYDHHLFAENQIPYERRFGLDEHTSRSTHNIWTQWENDPANPASPTFRPLHRDDY
jgi:hypothetical protein